MPRLAIVNMVIGFTTIFMAACAGAFLSLDVTEAFLYDRESLFTWKAMIHRSAHGHSNLFGMLHILFALTMPYSAWPTVIKQWQTIGLVAGTLAMGPVLVWRGFQGPTEGLDIGGVLMGIMLSATLIAIAAHIAGLMKKLLAREP